MLIGAFVIVVLLTWVLVAVNIRFGVLQFEKDKDRKKFYAHLFALLVVGSLIIGITSSIVQQVIDSRSYLQMDRLTAGPSLHR